MISRNIRVELLPNGYLRVFDYSCNWSALYTMQGEHYSGAVDSHAYRVAVREWLDRFHTRRAA